jgi:IS4 transposase
MDKDTVLSSFGKYLEPLHRLKLQEKIDQSNHDKYAKKLTTKAYILLFLHAQLQKREGLRAIADDLLQEEFQKEVGLESISAAQLSRKHRQVHPTLLAGIFQDLVAELHRRTQSTTHFKRNVKVIDSTTVSLCLQKYNWATFRQTKAGIKVHLRLVFANRDDVYPDKLALTTAKPSDRSQMDQLIDEEGATYVFDRGYLDYKRFDEFCANNIHFVTRLREDAVYYLLETKTSSYANILSDSVVLLGSGQKQMKHPLRVVEVLDSQGKLIRIATNRWDLSVEEISDLYRARWSIELFFKWIKQHVRIKNFYGTSQNAVWNQVYLALIAYCLLLLVKLETKTDRSLLEISRWLLALMWKQCETWIHRILRKPERTSRGRQKAK